MCTLSPWSVPPVRTFLRMPSPSTPAAAGRRLPPPSTSRARPAWLLVDPCTHLQVIERLDTVRVNKQGVPIEVALTQDMHHLGVARCLAWGIGQPDPELAKLSPAAATPTCWMVQEYCDKHTLVVSDQPQAARGQCAGCGSVLVLVAPETTRSHSLHALISSSPCRALTTWSGLLLLLGMCVCGAAASGRDWIADTRVCVD